jgi:hypothetical protein
MAATPPDSPAGTDEFLRKQAELEAAYRVSDGDPQVLCHALVHAYSSGRPPPRWLVWRTLETLVAQRTGAAARGYRARLQHVRRYIVVHNLRSNGHTKDAALDAAVEILAAQRAAAERGTIEKSYDRVKIDLDRQGSASEFFYLVALVPGDTELRADSSLVTADSTIPINAGSAFVPWFMSIPKR